MEAAKGDTNFFVRSQLVPSLTYRLVSVCLYVYIYMYLHILCFYQAATMRITAFQVAYLVTCKYITTQVHVCKYM